MKNDLYAGNDPLRFIDPLGLQEGPPIERVNPYDRRRYTCRCERNLFGFLFEWAVVKPKSALPWMRVSDPLPYDPVALIEPAPR